MLLSSPSTIILRFTLILFFSLSAIAFANEDQSNEPVPRRDIPPAPVLSAEQALETFELQKGFTVEVVAADPLIKDPVLISFDPNGRIWVCEMSSYMLNVDAEDEEEPDCSVVILEDRNGDGVMDKRKVFMKNAVLPRALLHVPGGILLADHQKLYYVESNNDKAGKKEVVDPDYAKGGNVEHKANGLLYNLDNWIYNAKSSTRYRLLKPEQAIPYGSSEIYRNKLFKIVKSKTAHRGQWGISNDDDGRLYTNSNGKPPYAEMLRPNSLPENRNYQPRIVDGEFLGTSYVYSLRVNPGVNRAYRNNVLTKNGKLKSFTSACSPCIYRGDNFPEDYYGQAFVAEPAANLIDGRFFEFNKDSVFGVHMFQQDAFLRSKDERFRPVHLSTAPDGTLYAVDFYRGIIQHKTYLTDYLKRQISYRNLHKGVHNGRIYRIRWKDKPAGPQPDLGKRTSMGLLKALIHPNGWWRDTARKLLVERQDQEVVPFIKKQIVKESNLNNAINMLWTLEGLNALDVEYLSQLIRLKKTRLSEHAIAIMRKIAAEDAKVLQVLRPLVPGDNYSMAMELLLTLSNVQDDASFKLLKKVLDEWGDSSLVPEAIAFGMENREQKFLDCLREDYEHQNVVYELRRAITGETVGKSENIENKFGKKALKRIDRGKKLYGGSLACFGCHGSDGNGMTGVSPPLNRSEWVTGNPERLVAVLLHGLHGPITVAGKNYNLPTSMPGLMNNRNVSDRDIADLASYMRTAWNNDAPLVEAELVERVRAKTRTRAKSYDLKSIDREFPQ